MNSIKKLLVSSCALTAMLTLTACQKAEDKEIKDAESADSVEITLLGTSDIHGHYMPWDYAIDEAEDGGSLAQIATYIRDVRSENEQTVLLDAGDFTQGNSAELFQELDVHPGIDALNELDYDLFVLGNHEFDFGMENLERMMNQFQGHVLAGNLYREDDADEPVYPATAIIERGDVKLGFVGLTTPMVYEFKEDTDTFDGYEFKDTVQVTRQAIDTLKDDVDGLIGVYHMGIENENDHPYTGLHDIADEFPEFDVIFGGHMHELENETINDVLIVEPEKYASHVSEVRLTFTPKTDGGYELKQKEAENIDVAALESDPDIEEILNPGHELARDDANIVLGQLTKSDLVPANDMPQIPRHQIEETPLTNFYSEVMMHYSNGADVVAHQIDNDQAQIKQGDIKKKDIAATYQYAGGEVTVFQITGQDLKDYMEWSADYFNQARPGDVTISFNPDRRNSKYSTHDIFGGVKYTFDLTEESGERVKDLTWLDGTPVDMDEPLTIGMNAYRMKFLTSEEGPLAGREFEQLYSTQDETAYGEEEGTIRQLAARYLKEEMNGEYAAYLLHHWQIVGVDDTPDDVQRLIREDIIDLGQTENGKGNIQSVNLKDTPDQKEINTLAERTKLEPKQLKKAKTYRELYQTIDQLLD